MFSSNLAESSSKVIQLREIDSISFSKILDFLYTGEISIYKDEVQDILQTAHMLLVNKILPHCCEFIQDSLCVSNCLDVMRLADMNGLSDLKKNARNMAVTNFINVAQGEEFLSLSVQELLDLLGHEDLKGANEDDVVQGVKRWLDNAPHDDGCQTAIQNILKETCLSCLRDSIAPLSDTPAGVLRGVSEKKKRHELTPFQSAGAEGLTNLKMTATRKKRTSWYTARLMLLRSNTDHSIQEETTRYTDKAGTLLSLRSNRDRSYLEESTSRYYTGTAGLFVNYARELLAELASQRQTGDFIDVVVQVGDREFPCHRAVLATTPYFKTMFSSNLTESSSEVIQLQGIDANSFSKVLDFLYTGEIIICKDDVQDILQTAHMLLCERILPYCCMFIQANLCPSNCLGVMRLADMYGLSDLNNSSRNMAVSNLFDVTQGEEFLSLSLQELLDLLEDKYLNVTRRNEADVVQSVIRWLDHVPESRQTAVVRILKQTHLTCVRVRMIKELELLPVIPCESADEECLTKIIEAQNKQLLCRQLAVAAKGEEAKSSPRREISADLAIIVGGWKAVRKPHLHDEHPAPGIVQPSPLQSIICLDSASRQYYHITDLPTPVAGYMSVACAGKYLYVTGGRVHPLVGEGAHTAPSRQAFRYDFKSDIWVRLPDMPRGRAEHHSVAVAGKLLLVGGDVEDSSLVTMDCYYPPYTRWMKLPARIFTSSNLTLTAIGGKAVFIEVSESAYERNRQKISVHTYNLYKGRWTYADIVVHKSLKDVDILTTAVDGRLYIRTVYTQSSDLYIFDAERNTLQQGHCSEGNFLRALCENRYCYSHGQKGIVDTISNHEFGNRKISQKSQANARPWGPGPWRPAMETSPVPERLSRLAGRAPQKADAILSGLFPRRPSRSSSLGLWEEQTELELPSTFSADPSESEAPRVQTPLPFALFGHSFLQTQKSRVGWYHRRDLAYSSGKQHGRVGLKESTWKSRTVKKTKAKDLSQLDS
ncbi:kelch repeat and BTB domain-containing protein 8-like [Branchiostoma floridae x Branchiostoma japonicum]